MESFISKLKNNKPINILGLAFVFLLTERTLRTLFIFSCTYRLQTLHTIAFLLCSWLVIIISVFKIREVPKIPVAYLIVYLSYLLSTVVNHGDYAKWLDIVLYSLPPLLLVTLMKDRKTLYLRIGTIIFAISAFLNLLFDFFPQLFYVISEWDEQYFMGYHTFVGWALTMGAFFALLDAKVSGKKTVAAIYLLLYFANMAVVYTGGAKIGAIIIALWLIFPFIRKMFREWNFLVFLIAVIVLFIVLMWCFEPFVNFAPVKSLVEDVLHRDTTLSGRLYVWTGVLERTLQNPVLGHGINESSKIFYEGSKWNQAMVHAHNAFLQTWYEGGILTLLLAIGMLAYAGFSLKKDSVGSITKMTLLAFLIMMQNDLDVYYTWYAVALICHMGISFDDGT